MPNIKKFAVCRKHNINGAEVLLPVGYTYGHEGLTVPALFDTLEEAQMDIHGDVTVADEVAVDLTTLPYIDLYEVNYNYQVLSLLADCSKPVARDFGELVSDRLGLAT